MFDEHAENLRDCLRSNRLPCTDGCAQLLGVDIADKIGHIRYETSGEQVLAAYPAWVRLAQLAWPACPAPLAGPKSTAFV